MGSLLCGDLEKELVGLSPWDRINTRVTSVKRKQRMKTIHSWKSARPLLEQWRKGLKTLTVELKQPRVIDAVPIDFVSEEPVERKGTRRNRFRGQLNYFTKDDVTLRRGSGAILIIENYEIVAISDGKMGLEPS